MADGMVGRRGADRQIQKRAVPRLETRTRDGTAGTYWDRRDVGLGIKCVIGFWMIGGAKAKAGANLRFRDALKGDPAVRRSKERRKYRALPSETLGSSLLGPGDARQGTRNNRGRWRTTPGRLPQGITMTPALRRHCALRQGPTLAAGGKPSPAISRADPQAGRPVRLRTAA